MASVVSSLQLQSEVIQLPLDHISALVHRQQWLVDGRADQMPPPERWVQTDADKGWCSQEEVGQWREDWFFWLLMAGRGAGKTRAGAEDTWWFGFMNPGSRIAIVAPTSNDCRKTCFEGESGLIARIPKHLIANWNRGELVLTMTNGTMYQGYSAEEPDRLRGPQHHRAWCDELAAWRYLDDTLDNLLMGLRLGEMPRIVATSTPRPLARLKEIVADLTTWVDTVSTYANLANLPKIFVKKILARYEGTRKGRQELHAEILTDNPGALWQRIKLDETRVKARIGKGMILLDDGRIISLARVVVAVDPASGGLGEDSLNNDGGDETGIIVVGLGDDGRGYVLADCTMSGTPGEWGEAVVQAYDDWHADRVIYEANQGGEMVRHTVVTSARAMRADGKRKVDFVPTEAVWASRGKVTRAEPVSALYEQGRVSHVGTFAVLEDQMCEFTPTFDKKAMGYSPDRMDALVWGINHLMLNDDAGTNIQDYYRQQSSRHKEALDKRAQGLGSQNGTECDMVELMPPLGTSTAIGQSGHMYSVNASGRMNVHAGDVEPLLRAGFTSPPDEEAA
jgi:phage terminase large subunit-like protein